MHKAILACLLAIQSGCAGIQSVTTTAEQKNAPPIGQRIGEALNQPGTSTKADVLRMWGSPKQRIPLGERELWVYDRDLAWRGVILWLFAPIPFLVPAGMNTTTVEFQRDTVVGFWNEHGNVLCWGQGFDGDYPCNPFLPPSFQQPPKR